MNGPMTGFPAEAGQEVRSQQGALCWRMNRGRLEVLLITSRDTGRWVIPKGWPMEGLGADRAAACEAWEEAGVEGRVQPLPVGFYSYDKVANGRILPCMVSVFPLHVTRLADKFPERSQRRRKWFTAEKASRKVAEAELRDLLARFAADPEALLAPTAPAPDAAGLARAPKQP